MSDDIEIIGEAEDVIAGLSDEEVGAITKAIKYQPAALSAALKSRLATRISPQARVQQLAQARSTASRSAATAKRGDQTLLGLSSSPIAAGASMTINVTPVVFFYPTRLAVPPSIAEFFTVDEFVVGNVPMFGALGSISAETLIPEALGDMFAKVTAGPGVPISLRVTNIDAAAHTFRATLWGVGAQPSA